MVLDDRFVELLAEGFDLAIRIGNLADSSLKARKLAEARGLITAAPSYLAAMGTPRSIDDLSEHRLLHYSQLSTGNVWRLRGPSGEERQVRVGGRLTVNNGEALMRAAEAGLGIAQVPSFMLGDALASGRLVEILTDRPPDLPRHLRGLPAGPLPAAQAPRLHRLPRRPLQGHGPGPLALSPPPQTVFSMPPSTK